MCVRVGGRTVGRLPTKRSNVRDVRCDANERRGAVGGLLNSHRVEINREFFLFFVINTLVSVHSGAGDPLGCLPGPLSLTAETATRGN